MGYILILRSSLGIRISFTFLRIERLWTQLNFVKNDQRFSFNQIDSIQKLKLKKEIIQIRYILKQIPYRFGSDGEIDQDIALILVFAKLFDNGRFSDPSGALYEQRRPSVRFLFPR